MGTASPFRAACDTEISLVQIYAQRRITFVTVAIFTATSKSGGSINQSIKSCRYVTVANFLTRRSKSGSDRSNAARDRFQTPIIGLAISRDLVIFYHTFERDGDQYLKEGGSEVGLSPPALSSAPPQLRGNGVVD